MKLLCLIDSLGSGGAQRQLTTLAVGLQKRGHEVRFLVYHPQDHFLPPLQEAGIPCHVIPPCSLWRRFLSIRRILHQNWQDAVVAFLEPPSLYAELAHSPGQRWGLVVGERSANPDMRSGGRRWIRHLHRLADVIVANSHANRLMLEMSFPFLSKKLATVYNSVDLEHFSFSAARPASLKAADFGVLRVVVAASYQENKNMIGLAKALMLLRRSQNRLPVVIEWFGNMQAYPEVLRRAEGFVVENKLTESFRFHSATRSISAEYFSADAVGLFSFYEGLPNVVCEGLACGKPILMSDVCDAGNLVRDGQNGFLFDPNSPESMANAIGRFIALNADERCLMGAKSRNIAETLLNQNCMVDRYERILSVAAQNKPIPSDCTWPTEVPESAVRTVNQWLHGKKANRSKHAFPH